MKSEKGMSHIAMTIIVIIIVIIAIIGIKMFLKEKTDVTIEDLATDMLLVQGNVKIVSQENKMKKEESPLIGQKIEDCLEDEKVKKLIDDGIISQEEEDFENYYIINSETIKELNLEDHLDGEYYLVNYETYEIIYTKGIDIEGIWHYKLTDILEHREEKEQKEEKTDNDNKEGSESQEQTEESSEEQPEEKAE